MFEGKFIIIQAILTLNVNAKAIQKNGEIRANVSRIEFEKVLNQLEETDAKYETMTMQLQQLQREMNLMKANSHEDTDIRYVCVADSS